MRFHVLLTDSPIVAAPPSPPSSAGSLEPPPKNAVSLAIGQGGYLLSQFEIINTRPITDRRFFRPWQRGYDLLRTTNS